MVNASATGSNLTPFEAGQSGNLDGRPKKGSAIADVIRRQLDDVHPLEAKAAEKEGRPARVNKELMVAKLIARAIGGDSRAFDVLMNRIDGKPRATIAHEGKVEHKHEHGQAPEVTSIMDRVLQLRERALQAAKPIDAEIVE